MYSGSFLILFRINGKTFLANIKKEKVWQEDVFDLIKREENSIKQF